MKKEPHVLLFDLYAGGHHGQYIEQLMRYWVAHDLRGRLDVVVAPLLPATHAEVVRLAEAHAATGIHLAPIDEPVRLHTGRPLWLIRNDREHGRQLRSAVERHRPDHVLLLYFDHAQVSLALDLRFNTPVKISGTYFRPSFHYAALNDEPAGPKERLKGWRKRVQLQAALRNPHFDTLFCLDPFAVPYIQRFSPRTNVVALPDGIEPIRASRTSDQVRADLGVEPGRRVLLLFGALSRRKGVFEVLAALHRLPDDACTAACVVLAGAVEAGDRAELLSEIARARQARTVQLVLRDAFLPDEVMQDLIEASDVMLVPYQRHLGSSGVLIRAAAARKPVLGDGYGLIGAQIRSRKLGLAVDAADPAALAEGLQKYLTQPLSELFDADEAAAFAGENTAEAFAETMFRHLMRTPHGPRRHHV